MLQHEDKANTNTKYEGQRPENKCKNRYKNILPCKTCKVYCQNINAF